jgi:ornithine cyclodeaminase/alanine dehydrogenase
VIEVLLLSQDDLKSLRLSHDEVLAAVEQALREHAAGTYEMHPKIGVHPTGTDPGNFIHAMPAYLHQLGACGLKWVGGFAKNLERGLPNVTGLQVCNDPETGVPLAIMDCAYLTGLRTAAVSTAIAKRCSRPDAQVLAICGCGYQGRLHLEFMVASLPGLREVRCYDVRAESVEALIRESGWEGKLVACQTPRECVEGADIVCTCTPGDYAIVEDAWLADGCFGVGIEGGCAFSEQALHRADKFLVDDVPLAEYFQKISIGRKNDRGEDNWEFAGGIPPVYATIGQVVAGQKAPRESEAERILAFPIGMAICDIALGHTVLARARAQGAGTPFRLC